MLRPYDVGPGHFNVRLIDLVWSLSKSQASKVPKLIKKYQSGEVYKAYGLIWAKTLIGGCFIKEINQGYAGMIVKIGSS